MPLIRGKDSKVGKPYYQYGKKGKKYYYKMGNKISREKAKLLAINAGRQHIRSKQQMRRYRVMKAGEYY